jgi:ABC-2 type transport system ATP-binding protein
MSNENAIEIHELTKSFKNLEVLKGINLVVKRGTMLALLGPNGAGKTTTVRILSTLLEPDSGHAFINGHDVVKDPQSVRSVIGLTGQYAAVDELLTGKENLEMMGKLYHLGKDASKTRTQELLKQFDLVDAASRPVKTYSGGMRRRLDLAVSLIAAPPILFLDEPTTGLDPRSRLLMWEIITGLMKKGTTILLTTQYLEEADKLANRIAVLDHGKIIAQGNASELKAMVGSERIELVIAQQSSFEKAAGLITGEAIKIDTHARSVSLSTDGSVREVKRILDLLSDAHIEIDSMSVHRPTLDDVFLRLTGRETEAATTKE